MASCAEKCGDRQLTLTLWSKYANTAHSENSAQSLKDWQAAAATVAPATTTVQGPTQDLFAYSEARCAHFQTISQVVLGGSEGGTRLMGHVKSVLAL